MITDEEETVAGFNIDLNSDLGFQEDDEDSFMCASNDQPMSYHQDDLMINEGFMNFYLYLYITTYLIYKVCFEPGRFASLITDHLFQHIILLYCDDFGITGPLFDPHSRRFTWQVNEPLPRSTNALREIE